MFLHWKYILTDTGKCILIPDKQRLTKKRKKLKKMKGFVDESKITIDRYAQSLQGMIAHLAQGNAFKAIQELLHIRKPLFIRNENTFA